MWLRSHIEKDFNFESLLIISARSDHVLTLNLENNNVDFNFVFPYTSNYTFLKRIIQYLQLYI